MAVSQKISPFLWFNGNAEEAAKLYVSIFPNSKITGTMPGPGGSVMGVNFELSGMKFMALNGGPEYKFTPAISMFVTCDSQEEVDTYWRKLTAEGGAENRCGWLQDRFGLSWQIIPTRFIELMSDKSADRRQRVTEAMLKMQKLDIAQLERAAAQG